MSTAKNVLEMILTLNAEAFKKGLNVAGTSVRTMASGASTAFSQVKSRLQENLAAAKNYNAELGQMPGLLRGIAAAGVAGAGAAAAVVVTTANQVRDLENLAKMAKSTSQEMAAMGFATEGAGISVDQLADISKDVQDKLGDFIATGGGEFKDFFENVAPLVGLTAEQLQKLSGPEVLVAVKKAMDDANISAAEQVFYLEAIGNDASKLIPLLENNGEALRQAAERARELGLALDEPDKKNLLEAAAATSELTAAMSGLKTQTSAALAPIYQEVVEKLTRTIVEHRDEIIDTAKAVAEFVAEHGKAIVTIGLLLAGAGALSFTISSLTGIWRGLNTVMLLLTGSQIIPFLGSIITTLKGVQVAALGTTAALGAAAGASLALIGGYSLGKAWAEWEYFRDVVDASKDALAEVPAKFAAISQATGVSIRSFEDLNKAQKDGLIRFNDVTGAWEKVAKSAEKSADDQANSQKRATDEMKQAYQDYADTVKKLQDDIANRERSLAEQLRDMARSGMSDFSAWKDRKAEAEEYAVAAKRAAEESKKAFAAGDTLGGQDKAEEAILLYDKAKDAAADLNREVKDGDTVIASQQQNLKTAMSLVEEYGRDAIGVQESLQEAIKQSAQALDAQSGGQLSAELPEIAKQFGDLKVQASDLAEASAKFNDDWNNAWSEFLADGKRSVGELDGELSQLTKDRHIKVYVEEVEKKRSGGLIGYMRGGLIQALAAGGSVVRNVLAGAFLPGFGGGDRRLLLGEDGEVMLNKFSVKEAGLRAALAFNAGNWGVVISELLKLTGMDIRSMVGYHLGGLVGSLPSLQSLSGGGAVEATGSSSAGKLIRHEHNLRTADGRQATVYTDDMNAGRLIGILRRAEVMSS